MDETIGAFEYPFLSLDRFPILKQGELGDNFAGNMTSIRTLTHTVNTFKLNPVYNILSKFNNKWRYNNWKKMKTLWQTEKLLVLSNFCFCHDVFISRRLYMRQNASASGKWINVYFHFDKANMYVTGINNYKAKTIYLHFLFKHVTFELKTTRLELINKWKDNLKQVIWKWNNEINKINTLV